MTHLMTGLKRERGDDIRALTGVLSKETGCSLKCKLVTWTTEFDKDGKKQAVCPEGYFLHGLTRAGETHRVSAINEGECCALSSDDQQAWGHCEKVDWTFSLDHAGPSRCPPNTALVGLYRAGAVEDLRDINEAKCCEILGAPPPAPAPALCQLGRDGFADWGKCFDNQNWCYADGDPNGGLGFLTGLSRDSGSDLRAISGAPVTNVESNCKSECRETAMSEFVGGRGWSECEDGHYIHGFRRQKDNKLSSLDMLSCCRVKGSESFGWGDCEVAQWTTSFDGDGTSKCPQGKFLVGLYRAGGTDKNPSDIDEARCCSMPGVGLAGCNTFIAPPKFGVMTGKWVDEAQPVEYLERDTADGNFIAGFVDGAHFKMVKFDFTGQSIDNTGRYVSSPSNLIPGKIVDYYKDATNAGNNYEFVKGDGFPSCFCHDARGAAC